MSSKDTIDTILQLLNKLKEDSDILIPLALFVFLFVYLFEHLATTLTNNPNAYPYPFNIIFTVLSLGAFILLITFTSWAFVSRKMNSRNNREDDED